MAMKLSVDQALRKAATHARAGENDAARQIYDEILERFPGNVRALAAREALVAPPHSAPPQSALDAVVALYSQRRFAEAIAQADELLTRHPDSEILHNIAGAAHAGAGRMAEAVAHYNTAIARAPDYIEAHNNRGNALKALSRFDEALASYDAAIGFKPDYLEAHVNRGLLLKGLRRADEALVSYEQALRIDTGHPLALGEAINLRAHMCLWSDCEQVLRQLDSAGDAINPFYMLTFADDPTRQLRCARAWTARRYPLDPPAGTSAAGEEEAGASTRIRLGYVSADFHNHATMHLMARLFELHDKDRFEIHAFSYGPDKADSMRARLLAVADSFHDIAGMTDAQAAALMRACGIAIAIDLKGLTETARPGIFAHRGAPVQISYLGYPGTMGTDFIDYVVADRVVIPEDERANYAETVLYLPHSYQVNDNQRPVPETGPQRVEMDLPETGFVFCSFNNNYKIGAEEFAIWMRLLAKVEGSVLWLLRDNRWAPDNLRREAARHGIDPDRLIFAGRVSPSQHLARHRCADLFLDTFNYNAHTTASDALWAGLPLVTKLGRSFAARVAGSLLHAMEMPELVTDTAEAYEALALDLATNPAKLSALRSRLAANRLTTPLFDSARFARDFEALLTSVYDGAGGAA